MAGRLHSRGTWVTLRGLPSASEVDRPPRGLLVSAEQPEQGPQKNRQKMDPVHSRLPPTSPSAGTCPPSLVSISLSSPRSRQRRGWQGVGSPLLRRLPTPPLLSCPEHPRLIRAFADVPVDMDLRGEAWRAHFDLVRGLDKAIALPSPSLGTTPPPSHATPNPSLLKMWGAPTV